MRISDWSSDVCSSDLISSALKMPRPYFLRPLAPEDDRPVFWRGKLSAPPVMRERAGVRLEWLKEVVDYIAGYFDLPNLNVPEFKVDTLEAVEIGRASCRERGCQYV